jgi:rhodanese-related sulfurtransferase
MRMKTVGASMPLVFHVAMVRKKLPSEATLMVMCRSGHRSAAAVNQLAAAGLLQEARTIMNSATLYGLTVSYSIRTEEISYSPAPTAGMNTVT